MTAKKSDLRLTAADEVLAVAEGHPEDQAAEDGAHHAPDTAEHHDQHHEEPVLRPC